MGSLSRPRPAGRQGRHSDIDEAQDVQDRLLGPLGAYESDRDLLRTLGLKLDGYKRAWTYLGTVAHPSGNVRIEVSAMPAQSWRYVVDLGFADHLTVISTGTGMFREYWPLVERVLSGEPIEQVIQAAPEDCFVVERIPRQDANLEGGA